MQSKQKEAEDQSILEKKREKERARAEVSDDLKFHTTMGKHLQVTCDFVFLMKCNAGKNIYRALFMSQPPVRNELFSPRRMVILC